MSSYNQDIRIVSLPHSHNSNPVHIVRLEVCLLHLLLYGLPELLDPLSGLLVGLLHRRSKKKKKEMREKEQREAESSSYHLVLHVHVVNGLPSLPSAVIGHVEVVDLAEEDKAGSLACVHNKGF